MRVTKEQNRNKGITLIALIITIIVMLILVAVTITVAVNGGLFEYAGRAATKTNEAIAEEQLLASGGVKVDGKLYASIDDYIKGIETLSDGTLKVNDKIYATREDLEAGIAMGNWYYCDADGKKGNAKSGYVTDGSLDEDENVIVYALGSSVNYTPDEKTYTPTEDWEYTSVANGTTYLQEELSTLSLGGWLLLGVDEYGCLELVSVNPTSASDVDGNYNLGLIGRDGYINGANSLTTACNELYGKATVAKGARNINEKDIEKISTFVPSEDYSDEDCGIHYGDEVKLKMMIPDEEGVEDYYLFFNVEHFDMDTWESANGEEMLFITEPDEDGLVWYSSGVTSFTYYDGKEWVELGEDEETTIEYDYYFYNGLANYITNSDLSDALTTGSDDTNDYYWVASPCVRFQGYDAQFGMRRVDYGSIYADDLYYSNGNENSHDCGLRPVVSLKSEVVLSAGTDFDYNISLAQ